MFSWKSNWILPEGNIPPERLEGRRWPQLRLMKLPEGIYRVKVTVCADTDCNEALVFIGRRHLVWRGRISAGEQVTVRTACAVEPLISCVGEKPETPGGIWLAAVGDGLRITEFAAAEDEGMRCVWLMGDSTVTDQPAEVPYAPGASYAAWGQMLQYMLGDAVCVSNHAQSGRTCETFRTEGHYDVIRDRVRPGDLVMLQFGHNDQKRIQLRAAEGYRERMLTYLAELRERGAVPVLVTPLARNQWYPDGAYHDMLRTYAEQILLIGREQNVPVIDLHGWMMANLIREGDRGAAWRYHDQDRTHTNDFGAYAAAAFISGELDRQGLAKAMPVGMWRFHGPVEALTAPVYTEKNRLTEAAAVQYTMQAEARENALLLTWSVPVDAAEDTTYCVMVNGVMLQSVSENRFLLNNVKPDALYELAVFDMPRGRMIACCRARTNR